MTDRIDWVRFESLQKDVKPVETHMTFQITDVRFPVEAPNADEIAGLFSELRRLAESDPVLRKYSELLEGIGSDRGPSYTPTVSFSYRISAA